MEDHQFEQLIEQLSCIVSALEEQPLRPKMGWPQAARLIAWYVLQAFVVYIILATFFS